MAGVTTFRSGNPTLTADTFAKYRIAPGVEQMTLGGTVNKTAMSLGVLLIAAVYIWNRGADDPRLGVWILVSSIAGLIVMLVTVFKHPWAQYTTLVYARLQGILRACVLARWNGGRQVHVLRLLRVVRTQIASFLKNLCAECPGGASNRSWPIPRCRG